MNQSKPSRDSGPFLRESIFCAEPLQRPNYYIGQVLGADDFTAEQEYHRKKQRQHNLHCHGAGVVNGLDVSTGTGNSGSVITVGAGVAIDPEGNEIHLCEPISLPLPESRTALQVGIRYAERFAGSVPALGEAASEAMPARIQEGCEIVLEPWGDSLKAPVRICAESDRVHLLPLARIIRRGKAWTLDRRFKPERSR